MFPSRVFFPTTRTYFQRRVSCAAFMREPRLPFICYSAHRGRNTAIDNRLVHPHRPLLTSLITLADTEVLVSMVNSYPSYARSNPFKLQSVTTPRASLVWDVRLSNAWRSLPLDYVATALVLKALPALPKISGSALDAPIEQDAYSRNLQGARVWQSLFSVPTLCSERTTDSSCSRAARSSSSCLFEVPTCANRTTIILLLHCYKHGLVALLRGIQAS